jgi:thiol-disulfide isomerase/thioredoxin
VLPGGGPATVVHDQAIFNSETRLTAELGITDWLSASVLVPLRIYRTSIAYLGGDGMPVEIENDDVHHRDETLIGVGDPWLVGRTVRQVGMFSLGARLGTTVPLGRTEEDPFALGDQGLRHEHSQFGTGTFQPIAGIEVTRRFAAFSLDASALTLQSLYENRHGYQAGDRYGAALGAASAFGAARWRFRGAVELQAESAERWNGVIQTEEGNTGRIDLLAGLEATWRFSDDWHVTASLRVPAYTRVEGGQLDVAGFLGLSIGTRLQLFEGGAPAGARPRADEHDHAGEHGHAGEHAHAGEHGHAHREGPADWTGVDKVDVSDDGSAVDLVPVPGKITVFDFWATWCKPCVELDHELAELARRHPGAVAIRKINTVDTDSPASRRYLKGHSLPHIKVFGRDGRLRFERSAAPAELAAAVERAIAEK